MSSDRGADYRLVEHVVQICARAQAPLQLLERVAALVRPRIPYDAAGWILVDPDTLLLTGVFTENITREQHLAAIECELVEDDVNKFADLARSGVSAASLSAATGGDLARSARYSTIYAPNGFGDEIRTVFRSGGAPWGHACLTRAADRPFYTQAEVDLVARLCPHIGNGIRTALLLDEATNPGGAVPASPGPALVVLADDGSIESMTPHAQELLGPLDDERLETTIVLHEVAQRARALADDARPGPPAQARARTRGGEWVVVRGARLESTTDGAGRSAVVLEPARPSDVAPMLMHLHQLTPREREVTQLLLAGLSTRQISEQLWITTETLRGHVKSVFAKLGVSSRPELAAMLSHEPAAQRAASAAG